MTNRFLYVVGGGPIAELVDKALDKFENKPRKVRRLKRVEIRRQH